MRLLQHTAACRAKPQRLKFPPVSQLLRCKGKLLVIAVRLLFAAVIQKTDAFDVRFFFVWCVSVRCVVPLSPTLVFLCRLPTCLLFEISNHRGLCGTRKPQEALRIVVLYCVMSCCVALCSVVLCCVVLCCVVLCCVVLCCVVLCCVVLCCVVFCCVVLCCVVLCCVVLCCVVLCCVMMCCVVL